MQIEQQVCTLEQAKRLKGLGVRTESICQWVHMIDLKIEPAVFYSVQECNDNSWYAYTVAELGEMLPMEYKHDKQERPYNVINSFKGIDGKSWYCHDEEFALKGLFLASFPTEAQARANCLIYLLENNLHTLPQ